MERITGWLGSNLWWYWIVVLWWLLDLLSKHSWHFPFPRQKVRDSLVQTWFMLTLNLFKYWISEVHNQTLSYSSDPLLFFRQWSGSLSLLSVYRLYQSEDSVCGLLTARKHFVSWTLLKDVKNKESSESACQCKYLKSLLVLVVLKHYLK